MKSVAWYSVSAVITAAIALSACGGGTNGGIAGGSGLTPVPSVAQQKKTHGKAQITIRIPRKKKAHRGHQMHPEYISPSTQSMTVVTNGVPMQTFNLTPTSPGCSSSAGSTTCSIVTFVPTGQQTLTFTLYDQTNGAGNKLSKASDSVTIAEGATTDVTITLNGVPATAKVLLNGSATASVPLGVATTVPASVTAYDADKNVIMSPGNYSVPVTLSDSDKSGATSLSSTSVTAPGVSITVSYTGGALSGSTSSAIITPGIGGTPQPSGAATLAVASPTPAPSPTPAIAQYQLPNNPTGALNNVPHPEGIVEGPDGALWIADYWGPTIDRVTTDGSTTQYPLDNLAYYIYPYGITAGADKALWFTEYGANSIGRITTGGTITEYSVPATVVACPTGSPSSEICTVNASPYGITAGADGAQWFTELGANQIGRIATDGTVVQYPIPTASSMPTAIAAGPDGALWFTEGKYAANKIGRITTSGTVTEYSIPTASSYPYSITAGPDGALWFAEDNAGKIGRITTAGSITEYSVPNNSNPGGITVGPDGALWFAESGTSTIGRITTSGAISQVALPSIGASNPADNPQYVTSGPNNTIWVTEYPNYVASVPVAVSPALRHRKKALHENL